MQSRLISEWRIKFILRQFRKNLLLFLFPFYYHYESFRNLFKTIFCDTFRGVFFLFSKVHHIFIIPTRNCKKKKKKKKKHHIEMLQNPEQKNIFPWNAKSFGADRNAWRFSWKYHFYTSDKFWRLFFETDQNIDLVCKTTRLRWKEKQAEESPQFI